MTLVQSDEIGSGTGQDTIHAVPVSALMGGLSPRLLGEDALHIQILAQMETPLPPILVQRSTMRVIDGMHRLRAARLGGRMVIDVQFFDGGDAEALLAAVKANADHGLPLTLADRLAAGERIVALRPWQSDRWIAEVTGLAPATVGAIRRRSLGGNDAAATRVGRDGRERPVDIAARRRAAADAIRQHPDASLRVIARMTGLSPGTVRDVRQRVLRGDDPLLPVNLRREAGPTRRAAPHRAAAGQREGRLAGRDIGTLLRNLRRDPSLRLTERGRGLLEFLTARTAGPAGLEDLVSGVPDHCLHAVARLARQCAAEWQEAARLLEEHLGHM
ncbi:MAG: ParB/RepB/Spo0J family partition protein [Streptosporangiaceae bacterium]